MLKRRQYNKLNEHVMICIAYLKRTTNSKREEKKNSEQAYRLYYRWIQNLMMQYLRDFVFHDLGWLVSVALRVLLNPWRRELLYILSGNTSSEEIFDNRKFQVSEAEYDGNIVCSHLIKIVFNKKIFRFRWPFICLLTICIWSFICIVLVVRLPTKIKN